MMKTFVIVPAHNEAKYLPLVFKKLSNQSLDVILVDDGSTDDTASLARTWTPHVLVHETNLGKGASLKTGCEFAFNYLGAQAVIFMDADDQHDPQEIERFLKALKSADIVFGVRNQGASMPFFRYLWNKSISILVNLLFGAYIPDIPSGYRALSKSGYQKLQWQSLGYEVEAEIAMKVAKQRLNFVIVPIHAIYHDEDKGMTCIDGIRIVFSLLKWRFFI